MLGTPQNASAQIVSSPVTNWNQIRYNGVVPNEPASDQQTGTPEGDFVGDAARPFLFSLFDAGTVASKTDGTLYFKMRIDADSQPVGFKGLALIGFSFTSNVANQPLINVFAGVDNSGSPDRIRIFRADPTKTNISPSTSGIGAELFNYVATSLNYDFSPVSAVNEPGTGSPFNFNSAANNPDYFLAFSIPFADLVSAVNTTTGLSINEDSQFRMVAFNATNSNTLNQDVGGINDRTTNPALPFSDLNAISNVYATSSLLPTPAPPGVVSGLIGIAMAGGQFGLVRRRERRRAKKSASRSVPPSI